MGSPPRRRGKGTGFVLDTGNVGITPAQAGKSIILLIFFSFYKDHPRVGGEKIIANWLSFRKLGSPPRGRGKVEKREVA